MSRTTPKGSAWSDKGYHWYAVAAGERPGQCRSCKAVIYWTKTRNDKPLPVDCETVDGSHAPTEREEGRGVSHFQTCPNAEQHSRKGGARG